MYDSRGSCQDRDQDKTAKTPEDSAVWALSAPIQWRVLH